MPAKRPSWSIAWATGGFLIGVFTLFWALGSKGVWTVSFPELKEALHLVQGVELWGIPLLAVVGICFFVGATGKSAQIPLYVWLPDAMAGPTPRQRPYPRGHHGNRRRLHDSAAELPLHRGPDGPGGSGHSGVRHGPVRGHHRHLPN